MALGNRKTETLELWVATTELPRSPGRPFYKQLNRPLAEQQQTLNQKLRGHYAYYGVARNSEAMNRFRQEVENRWRESLNRRNSSRSMHWRKFCELLRRRPLAPAPRCAPRFVMQRNPDLRNRMTDNLSDGRTALLMYLAL